MPGVYLHIPFCLTRCHYCDFYSVTQMDMAARFAEACRMEIQLRKASAGDQAVDTIYFGGGTPSALNTLLTAQLMEELQAAFTLDEDAETTIEVNPDDLTPEKLTDWKSMGFNRISIGIQSFRPEDLKLMNRRHDHQQALEAPLMAQKAGFSRISVDLIYGIPGLLLSDWEKNLDHLGNIPVTHVSAYHLTFEPGTVFNRWKEQGKIREADEELSLAQYQILVSALDQQGLAQYEISNFARNQQYSRHNIKYWNGSSYLGFGPSAHSFNGKERQWNKASLKDYLAQASTGVWKPGSEEITATMHRNELIMTRLRTVWGIHKQEWEKEVPGQSWDALLDQARNMLQSGHLHMHEDRLTIAGDHFFQADGIIARLFA